MLFFYFFFFFFFKQKTAYEMRISDWSSDVCSSDLVYPFGNISGLYTFLPIAAAGLPTVLLEKFDVAGWLDYVKTYRPKRAGLPPAGVQIGRASCRERVCQYV